MDMVLLLQRVFDALFNSAIYSSLALALVIIFRSTRAAQLCTGRDGHILGVRRFRSPQRCCTRGHRGWTRILDRGAADSTARDRRRHHLRRGRGRSYRTGAHPPFERRSRVSPGQRHDRHLACLEFADGTVVGYGTQGFPPDLPFRRRRPLCDRRRATPLLDGGRMDDLDRSTRAVGAATAAGRGRVWPFVQFRSTPSLRNSAGFEWAPH